MCLLISYSRRWKGIRRRWWRWEIGLDLFGDDPQFERQQWLLDEQLKLAKRYDLPVILHSRRTHDKLAMHLKRHDLPCTGVVHGFSGSLQQAERFVQLGYKIGVGGTITYPRASKTRDVIAKLPLASLLLETDAPDMPLNGFQGQANAGQTYANNMSQISQQSAALAAANANRPSALRQGVSGAASGALLGGGIASALELSTPWGAGIGAGLGLLGSLF